jgi:hypothetical protein
VNGYVEAGYTVVGVTLAAYAVWILLRSRSIARVLPAREPPRRGSEPAREGEAEARPPTGLVSPSPSVSRSTGGRGWSPARDGEAEAIGNEERGWR